MKKFITKNYRAMKAIILLSIGFIKPIHSITEPDETTYRCTLKGVESSYGLETWAEVFADLKEYVKEV